MKNSIGCDEMQYLRTYENFVFLCLLSSTFTHSFIHIFNLGHKKFSGVKSFHSSLYSAVRNTKRAHGNCWEASLKMKMYVFRGSH